MTVVIFILKAESVLQREEKKKSWEQICPQKKDKQSRRQSERAKNMLKSMTLYCTTRSTALLLMTTFYVQVDYIDPSFIVGAKDKDESIAMFAFQGRGNGWVDRGKHCLCPKKQFPANRQTLRMLIVSFFTNILHFAIKQIRRSLMIFSFLCNAM